MGPEFVTVSAGGMSWSAFEKVTVTAGADEAARSFLLEIAAAPDPTTTSWVFACGTEISIVSNGDLLVTGYVDRYRPSLKDHNRAFINVSGRSKAQDAIDSSALHPTGNFQNRTVLQIAQALDQSGVGFTTDQALSPIPFYQITPGETVFRCIEKLCRQQGLLLQGQPDGSVMITKASSKTNSPLIEGYNCKELSADHNWSGRHSQVIARGQRPIGIGAQNTQIEATASDGAVTRNRPAVIVIDEDTDQGRAQTRADWRLAREAGEALTAQVLAQSFHDDAGVLWTPGYVTFLDSPFLAVQQNMAIKSVTYSQAREQGSVTLLSLVDPRALGGQSGSGGTSNQAWTVDQK